jgi:hypothetical protein
MLGNEPHEPRQVALARRGEPEATRRTNDELLADRLLELGDALGDDGSRCVQLASGGRKAPEPRDADERIDVLQVVDRGMRSIPGRPLYFPWTLRQVKDQSNLSMFAVPGNGQNRHSGFTGAAVPPMIRSGAVVSR